MYRVMIADDEPMMRKALSTFINWEELNCNIIYSAVNGQDVLEHLEDMKPDILITDIKMPGKDGIEIAKYIWEEKLPIKVVLLTAYADFSYAQSAVKYDVVDYVTKTGAFEDLSCAIDKCTKAMESEMKPQDLENKEEISENFFRAVIDGSLYDEQDILAKYKQLNLSVQEYLVVLFQFQLSDELDSKERKRIHKSLQNFFTIAFGTKMVKGLFVKKNLFCGILEQIDQRDQEIVEVKCKEIVDVMDNFMKLEVFIGVSEKSNRIVELKECYDQAYSVIENNCFTLQEKICFYQQGSKLRKNSLMEDCMEYIEKHYEENITISDIALTIGTSASYLSRIFKETTGNTLISTINQKKMERAKEYLSNTDLKIYEIADRLGFENTTYFSHFFKKHTGQSPKDYR